MVLPYTKIFGKTSTNIVTPTDEETAQGNNQLTPFVSSLNNGYSNQISQATADVNEEIINAIEKLGGTPSSSNDNLASALGTAAAKDTGILNGKVPLIGTQSASETLAGLAPLATQSLTDAGSNDLTIITPKKLKNGFAISLGATGYIKLPSWLSGFTMMWGSNSFSSGSGGTTIPITFPASFTNAVRGITGNNNSATPSGLIVEFTVPSVSGTIAHLNQRNNESFSAGAVSWFAIGY